MKNVTYVTLWRMLFQLESVGVNDFSNILRLVELCFVFAVANAKPEQGFSHMRRMESDYRSRLSEMSLSAIMRISMDGQPYIDYDSTNAVEKFLKSKQRRLGGNQNKKRPSGGKVKASCSKEKMKTNLVQEKLFDLSQQ